MKKMVGIFQVSLFINFFVVYAYLSRQQRSEYRGCRRDLKQYSITIKANKILLISIHGGLCVLRGLPKPFICNLPWRVVGNGLVYSGVIDGVELVGLVVDDDVVVEPMAPQYLVGHVRRSNL